MSSGSAADPGSPSLGENNALMSQSAYVSNVATAPSCRTLPWRHLLHGSAINPSANMLVGAFGTPAIGYHSELKCLMNGTHDNGAFYGGDGQFRTDERFCNFCRELRTFRIYERLGVLDDPRTSLATWEQSYRARFYAHHGFQVPDPTPQRNSQGAARYQACVP